MLAQLARLVTHLRGVRQRDAREEAEAAEHCALLSKALAEQPYKAEASFLVLFAAEHKPKVRKPVAKAAPAAEAEEEEEEPAAAPVQRRDLSLESAWRAALMSVPACAAMHAAAVAHSYPSPAALLAAYAAPGMTPARGKELLKDLALDVAAGAKARRLGPALSERLFKIFKPREKGDSGAEFA